MSNTRRAFNAQINDSYLKFKDDMADDMLYKHLYTCEFYRDMNFRRVVAGASFPKWRRWIGVQRELRINMNKARKLP